MQPPQADRDVSVAAAAARVAEMAAPCQWDRWAEVQAAAEAAEATTAQPPWVVHWLEKDWRGWLSDLNDKDLLLMYMFVVDEGRKRGIFCREVIYLAIVQRLHPTPYVCLRITR